ncbi:MAG: sigma-70 family RNA polymerase sigma factor [Deltaproteobacteria bacterium]|nr:sigma-70 family RNA polymerase sigma factor [Deltaproteobacteria bacterium]
MNESGLDDLRLARQARQDPSAARAILDRLMPRIRHAVFMLVGGDQEAEDLTHVCLLEILENLGGFRGTGPLEAWAGQLTFRVVMRHMKRRRRGERTVALVPEETGVSPSNPERDAERGNTRERLAQHMKKLPIERRTTLVLRLVLEHSVAEVAELTGVPVNTARDRIRVGLRELRQSMAHDPAFKGMLSEGRDE